MSSPRLGFPASSGRLVLHAVFVPIFVFLYWYVTLYLYLYMAENQVLYIYILVANICNSVDNISNACCLELTPSAGTLAFGHNLRVQPL